MSSFFFKRACWLLLCVAISATAAGQIPCLPKTTHRAYHRRPLRTHWAVTLPTAPYTDFSMPLRRETTPLQRSICK